MDNAPGAGWRSVRDMSMTGETAKSLLDSWGGSTVPGAVEGVIEGPWLRLRTQKTPESEILEFAIPVDRVNYVRWQNA